MANALSTYNRKRNFTKTGEPEGEAAQAPEGRLRFVVQHHAASRDHYDFRLEWEGVLKSWAVPKGPSFDHRDKRLAVQVEDHPLEYRNFEGTIPKGQYGGGTVMIWDEGYWAPYGDATLDLADGNLKFFLAGSRMKGKWALIRMKAKPGEKDTNWLLIKEKDEYENSCETGDFPTSLRTGRSMDEIAEDKKAKTRAMPRPERSLENFKITNPDKVLYKEAGITKGDIALYYLKVAGRMLPYLENRILSTVRCPGGVQGDCFYKKHPAGQSDGVMTFPVPGRGGESEDYFYIADTYGLMSEVQMNTLEFHTWGSRVETLENPDLMVFDLDPDEGLDLEKVRQGVRDLKGLLDQLSLKSYLKTSGGKGYHLVIPFRPAAGWDSFHDFARNLSRAMEAKWPDRYTSNVKKSQRKNRIFIDWIRNGRGATSIAPYSVRARGGAPVSMPITWKELDSVAPNGISMEEALSRLAGQDPWSDFFENDQRLK